jgi:hypothetical protein
METLLTIALVAAIIGIYISAAIIFEVSIKRNNRLV